MVVPSPSADSTIYVEIALNIPEDIARLLEVRWGNVSERAAEAVAAEAYREGALTSAEVGRMLGHTSRWETHDFLKRMQAHADFTAEDVQRDTDTIREVLGE